MKPLSKTDTNSFFGRIAAQSVSERLAFGGAFPHALKCIPVCCDPGALHFIPKI
jgi:hypothetical protein